MQKIINFDMDGTLANFYGVPEWLECLENSDPYPYAAAEPLLNFSLLARLLNRLQRNGYEINIISWLSRSGTEEFNEEVADIKLEWLSSHLPSVHFDRISIIPYGTPKSLYGDGILFDDEEKNRNDWRGIAFDEKEIIEVLKRLL